MAARSSVRWMLLGVVLTTVIVTAPVHLVLLRSIDGGLLLDSNAPRLQRTAAASTERAATFAPMTKQTVAPAHGRPTATRPTLPLFRSAPVYPALDSPTAANALLASHDPRCANASERAVAHVLYNPTSGFSQLHPPVGHAEVDRLLKGGGWKNPVVKWPSSSASRRNKHPTPLPRPTADVVQAYEDSSIRAKAILTQYAQRLDAGMPWSPHPEAVVCHQRNALITAAMGYTGDQLQPFVASFQRFHGPCDELVLFVTPEKVNEATLSFDATRSTVRLEDGQRYTPTQGHHVAVQRVEVFRRWLSSNHHGYHYVVAVDARDTVFFDNMFDRLREAEVVGLFTAQEVHTYNSSEINNWWIDEYVERTRSGEKNATLRAIASRQLGGKPMPILCAGFYGGTSLALLDYLTAYWWAMELIVGFGRFPLDQGAHNLLFVVGLARLRFPHPVVVLDEAVGPVHHWFPAETHALRDRTGRYVNCRLRPYAVLHQLDRYNALWSQTQVPYKPVQQNNQQQQHRCVASPLPPAAMNASERVANGLAPGAELRWGASATRSAGGHYTCVRRNALLLVVPLSPREDAAKDWTRRTIAAFQRYHSPCDEVVVLLVPSGRADEEDGAAQPPTWVEELQQDLSRGPQQTWPSVVAWLVPAPGVADRSGYEMAADRLRRGQQYGEVLVLRAPTTDGVAAGSHDTFITSGIFGGAAGSSSRGAWFVEQRAAATGQRLNLSSVVPGIVGGAPQHVASALRWLAGGEGATLDFPYTIEGFMAEPSSPVAAPPSRHHRHAKSSAAPSVLHGSRGAEQRWGVGWSVDGRTPMQPGCPGGRAFSLVVVSAPEASKASAPSWMEQRSVEQYGATVGLNACYTRKTQGADGERTVKECFARTHIGG